MIIVIQCAAGKRHDAGHLRRRDGKPVLFVADPQSAPHGTAHFYARPDDLSDTGVSWRARLLDYNERPATNPLNLLPAWQLYRNPIYQRLANTYGLDKTYVLSAGWGLISADFLTPAYDITFSPSADKYKRRRKKDFYDDLCMLPPRTGERVVFFGGKDYVPLFCSLTANIEASRIVFYSSATPPNAPGCSLKRFRTTTRTNWHYECAGAFMDGQIAL